MGRKGQYVEDGNEKETKIQKKLFEELHAINERLDQLKNKVESITGIKSAPEPRIETFIEGFDEALDGGIPAGHVVLLAGPSGTMKTSLALYIMQKNRALGAKGIYITLEESRESLLKTMARLGIASEEDFIVDIGKLRTEHEAAEETRDWIQVLKDYLTRRSEKHKLNLVVVDPLNSLYSLAGLSNPRKDLFHFFSFLRNLGVTSFLISEAETNNQFFCNHEDFLADGVITLNYFEKDDSDFGLNIRCLKMRHSNHSRVNLRLHFNEGRFKVSTMTPKVK